MWYVYILYSKIANKTYVGYTNDVERRFHEHNESESRGFTLRYRPWVLIHTEPFVEKREAMKREKFLKTGRGREEIRIYVTDFVNTGAVSAAAEKD